MKKIRRVIQKDQNLMHLTWMVNNICQNRCAYCIPGLNSGKGHHYKWENAKRFMDILFEKYPKIHCSVTGGEPSISSFFPELVQRFVDAGHTIGTTTNGFKPVEYWKEISKNLSYVCFSYHPEQPTEDFLDKVLYCSLNTMVTVRIMMHPRYWDHCVEVYNDIRNIPTIFVEPVRCLDWGSVDRTVHLYDENQLAWFRDVESSLGHEKYLETDEKFNRTPDIAADFEMDDETIERGTNTLNYINSGQTNFKGYVCEVGLKSLFIDHSGEIFLGNCCIGGPQGHMDEPDQIEWPTKRVICSKHICHCSIDVNINKWTRGYFRK
jgi:organic radical activating enzyme